MIKVAGLKKRHGGGGALVLKGVSFELGRATISAILGASGAGKTTLLRCVVGIEDFEEGEIEADGAVVSGADRERSSNARSAARRALRSRVGLVFQSFELFPHLRVLDNLTLAPMRVRKIERGEAERKARALLDQFGLSDKAGAFPDHLSGGQRQRVAIARALAMEPRVLLYDEPTAALDPKLKLEVAKIIADLRSTGITQIIVTHDVSIARAAAERVFILDQGLVVEQGLSSEVLDNPRHEATRRLLGAE